jgi:colanic acid/amylovoran biosynthesis glycosyltransferase
MPLDDSDAAMNADAGTALRETRSRPQVAYLVNQYPKVSHSFIRREIQALERLGLAVQRYALRGWSDQIADDEDLRERQRTRYLLAGGVGPLAWAVLVTMVTSPGRYIVALRLAWAMSRRADRPWPLHLIYFFEACLLRRWMAASGIDHLHAHFGTNPAEVAALTHALGGPPFSFTVHGPEEFDKPQALHLACKARDAAFVAAVSSYGRSQLYRWLPVADWPKVQVVHCGLESAFHAVPAQAPTEAPRLVCIGRLCAQKGQLLLVRAAARLRRAGVPLQLVLAGDGDLRPAIEALVRECGIERDVEITGWVDADRVRREILAARALVLPSFAEGLPVVLMEAMALRRPVISTFVAGIPELVRPDVDGWLVPPGDEAALVAAMRACLSATPATLQAMGLSAYERVLQRHSIDVEAAKLAALFCQPARRLATPSVEPVHVG